MQDNKLNPLEESVLAAFAAQEPGLALQMSKLAVCGREFTGVGCYTSFRPSADLVEVSDGPLGLDGLIEIPGISDDLGASIHIANGQVQFLEIVAFASSWSGAYEGFAVRRRA